MTQVVDSCIVKQEKNDQVTVSCVVKFWNIYSNILKLVRYTYVYFSEYSMALIPR